VRHRSFLLERVTMQAAGFLVCKRYHNPNIYTLINNLLSCLTGQRTRMCPYFVPIRPQLRGLTRSSSSTAISCRTPPTDRPTPPKHNIHAYYHLTAAHFTNMSSSTVSASPSASTAPKPSNPSHSRPKMCPTPSSPRTTSAGRSWTRPTSRPRPST
jgi:hypothetical protein